MKPDRKYEETISLHSTGHALWIKADIQIEASHEHEPSVADCRYAAMRLYNKGKGYVVFDRVLNRIVDGVYYNENALRNALEVAQWLNEGGEGRHLSPNGTALGLVYPSKDNLPEWEGTWKAKDWLEKEG